MSYLHFVINIECFLSSKNANVLTDGIPIIFVANKSDLASKRVVDTATAKAFADKHQLVYVETSAKTNTNVNQAFMNLAEMIVPNLKTDSLNDKKPLRVSNTNKKKEKTGWNCVLI